MGARTPDLLITNELLYQLSYGGGRVRRPRTLTDDYIIVEVLGASALNSKPRASRYFLLLVTA